MYTKLVKHSLNYMLYAVLCIISLYFLTQKVDFHVDELLTFNLANAENWFTPEDGVIYSPASYPFIEAMSSTGNFDLRHVWAQQAYDTHPPLYYVLVHAVCTLFPGTVSVLYAGIINVIFLLLTLFFYRKILNLLIDISIATFLRMYVMTMFWVTFITYIVLKNIKRFNKRNFISLFIVTICGALTHYYFIAYVCLLSLVVVIIFVNEKRIKETILYIFSMIISGAASFLIFPAMKDHLLHGARGAESLHNFIHSDLISQLKTYFSILNKNVFGGLLPVILFWLLIFLLITKIRLIRNEDHKKRMTKVTKYRFLCLIVPVLGYMLLISKSAPYNTDRYISPIYAIVIAGVMSLLYVLFSNIVISKSKGVGLFVLCVAIVVLLNWATCDWDYLYTNNKPRLINAEIYGKNANAICVYDAAWKINSFYSEISKCSTSTFYQCMNYDDFISRIDSYILKDNIAFFVIGIDAEDFIDAFLNDFPEYRIEIDNGQWGYGQSVYLYRT